jgi:hypothetical protein
METWLLAGAGLQAVTFLVIGRAAIAFTGFLLTFRLFLYLLKDQGIVKTNSADKVYWGKWGTRIPQTDGSPSSAAGGNQITVFLLAARSNQSVTPTKTADDSS